MELVRGVDKEWANPVDMDGPQRFNLLTVQPGSMEGGSFMPTHFQIMLSPTTTSKDQDHADGNGECHSNDPSGEAVGSDSNVFV
jgi:hypothetical protein